MSLSTELFRRRRHTCLKLEEEEEVESIFVKGIWLQTHFILEITNGFKAWVCKPTPDQVSDRAEQWDEPVSQYLEMAESRLAYKHPDSVYGFTDAGNGHKRLSWTFEKQGTKLEWRWKCEPAADDKQITGGILDFLLEANTKLSDEVINKTGFAEKMKTEAEKCLEQTETLVRERQDFESDVFSKFAEVLNAKKAKLRELRDKIARLEAGRDDDRLHENESSDKTESNHEETDDEDHGESHVSSEVNHSSAGRMTPKKQRTA